MKYFVPVLLSLSAWASALEPLPQMIEERRGTHPVYAKSFMDEYEPYAMAAIPLNTAMPFFQLITPGYRTKNKKPVKPRPQRNQYKEAYAYDSSNNEEVYEPYSYDTEEVEVISPQKYPKSSPYDEESSSVVVYARPNKYGGYSYRKHPSQSSHSSYYSPTPSPIQTFSSPQAHDQKPVIIRIHKYRVIH
ncbi:uncharacterized protein LOC116770947 [Danaus plexippus]|uniref:uncharacterized protein LOC116770947 n=1 Tax=Danaus plexippus TaxID=13037 RepID=UPI002AB2EAB7|nr:uncharacterized protein LOC116770947 [Danaus plexippus]